MSIRTPSGGPFIPPAGAGGNGTITFGKSTRAAAIGMAASGGRSDSEGVRRRPPAHEGPIPILPSRDPSDAFDFSRTGAVSGRGQSVGLCPPRAWSLRSVERFGAAAVSKPAQRGGLADSPDRLRQIASPSDAAAGRQAPVLNRR